MKNPIQKFAVAVLATCLLSVSGCSSGSSQDQDVVRLHGSTALPSASLEDWASYAQIVSVATITQESELAPVALEGKPDAGTISRRVTASFGETLWRQSGYPTPILDRSLSLGNGGWFYHGRSRQQWLMEDQTYLEPGQTYLMVLSYTALSAESPAEWTILDALPIKGGRIDSLDEAETAGYRLSHSARAKLNSMELSTAKTLLAAIVPDPAIASTMGLDPIDRFEKLNRTR